MSSHSLENIPSLPDKAEGALLSLSAGDAIGWLQELPKNCIGITNDAYAAWLLLRKSTTLQFGELIRSLLDSVHCWDQLPGSSNGRPTWYENAEYKTGDTYQQVWGSTVEEVVALLNIAQLGIDEGALSDDYEILRELGCYGREKGSGTVSAVAAVYLASRYANQPNEGILLAAFNKGTDTDTLAAMVGGLLGSLQGTVHLPYAWFKVQDANYIRNVASQLLQGPDGARKKPVCPFTDPMNVLDSLGVIDDRSSLEIADRTIEATRIPEPRCRFTGAITHAWKLTTEEGQTLYINKVSNKDH